MSEDRTWYVVIPFISEESAQRALQQIEATPGFMGHVRSGIEDDPPEYGPDDAEAQRITETCADANQEHDRIENEEAGR